MVKLKVNASKNYDILIGENLLDNISEYIKNITKNCRAVIITDDTVSALYSDRVEHSLSAGGYTVSKFVFPHGENSKNLTTLGDILEALCSIHISRSDILIALGGGVVGDITGFAASVYMRGIKYIQVPTTLLAAVDSSVGGKTAVDLAGGKNLAGTFYQPSLVVCDYTTLNTLSDEIYSEGCAEIIKYGFLAGNPLFNLIEKGIKDNIEEVISQCIQIKSRLVQNDEFDTGDRQFLNLGHTVGHAVEKCSSYSISHGYAVAIGMAVITKAAVASNFCTAEVYDSLVKLLARYDLPVSCTYNEDELFAAAINDKKHCDGLMTIIMPESIGLCKLVHISDSDLKKYISLGI